MGRYNTKTLAPKRTSVLKTVFTGRTGNSVQTHAGGVGFVNDEKSELFRLGVNLFAGGEDTFYDSGNNRDSRFTSLVGKLAVSDPDWTLSFLKWLRQEGNIRTASVLGAVYAIHARLQNTASDVKHPEVTGYNRKFAAEVPNRLDEVPELFAVWSKEFGKPFPSALKRGAGDALKRLGNEYSFMKYDTSSHAWRIADVLGISHVTPSHEAQAALYRMAIANRYGNPVDIPEEYLPMFFANAKLRAEAAKKPKVLLDPVRLKAAGFTWEDALSLAGNKISKKDLWEALIMGDCIGYMAMLRNLRNFEQEGIGSEATNKVISKLSNPEAVARSRQFPYRFWSAYKNAKGTQWAHPLELGLNYSTSNIPELPGRTLALIDTSGSMSAPVSNNSSIRCDESAAVFAAALAARNPGRVDLYMFADRAALVKTTKGGSVLRTVDEIRRRNGEVGYGTQTGLAVQQTYNNHDRVMVFTDGQSFGGWMGNPSTKIPQDKYFYAWDVRGYKHMDIPSGEGTRHQLAGLTDKTFNMVPLLERGRNAKWPWE